MNPKADPPLAATPPAQKPRLSILIATAFGLGYLPKAPGTFGSLAGVALAIGPFGFLILAFIALGGFGMERPIALIPIDPFILYQFFVVIATAALGVWSGGRAAKYFGMKDPQKVVIDEVSGQHLTLVIGRLLPVFGRSLIAARREIPLGYVSLNAPLNWKYLLLGFILFRVFDIWKPWPIRRLEKLPGGWGIMADDWMAGLYAAILLRIALHFGLLSLYIGWT